MAGFRVPTFPLRVNVWRNTTGVLGSDTMAAPVLAGAPANLAYGERVQVMSTGGTGAVGVPSQVMNLLLTAGSDVRASQNTGMVADAVTGIKGDYVEAPADSGRWYVITFVDDVGKGFANEHRTASLLQIPGTWTTPSP